MTIRVRKELRSEDTTAVWAFLNALEYIPYQQFPEYPSIEALKTTGFIAMVQDKVVGWAQVVEKKNVLAIIEFGPLGQTETIVQELFLFIAHYYKKHLFLLLRWIPYCYGPDVYNRIAAAIAIRFSFLDAGSLIHWSSKRIPLQEDADGILKTFSENHRRSIKKAVAQNLTCKVIEQDEVAAFSRGFTDMYQHRKLNIDGPHVAGTFRRLHDFLNQSGRGFFMGAFHQEVLLGGVVIIYQGNTAFYYKGFANHEQRQYPINHIVFYHAILKAKADGMLWFDFGGYAVDAADSQLVNINKFKDGFRGDLIHFPKTQVIQLWWIARPINKLLQHINRKYA